VLELKVQLELEQLVMLVTQLEILPKAVQPKKARNRPTPKW
jgi:hypothetical protein